jgi:hypothetical protein
MTVAELMQILDQFPENMEIVSHGKYGLEDYSVGSNIKIEVGNGTLAIYHEEPQ